MIFRNKEPVEVFDPLINKWIKTTVDCYDGDGYYPLCGWICVASFRRGHVGPVEVPIRHVRRPVEGA